MSKDSEDARMLALYREGEVDPRMKLIGWMRTCSLSTAIAEHSVCWLERRKVGLAHLQLCLTPPVGSKMSRWAAAASRKLHGTRSIDQGGILER